MYEIFINSMSFLGEILFYVIKVGVFALAFVWVIKNLMSHKEEDEDEGLKIKHINKDHKRKMERLEYALLPQEMRHIALKDKHKKEKQEAKSKKKEAKKASKEASKKAKKSNKETKKKEAKKTIEKATEKATEKASKSIQTTNSEVINSESTNSDSVEMNTDASMTDSEHTNPIEDQQNVDDTQATQNLPVEAKETDAKQSVASQENTASQENQSHTKRLFVIDFKGDIQASEVDNLRHIVTALIHIAKEQDQVLLRLHNSGGYVHTHGLAASQLTRLKNKGIHLTIAVDQVAASGGYMMACVADHIIAAPFAIIGSIGVVAQVPNINRFLKRFDVDIELHTAGEYKRTLTMLGENTPEGRQKFIEDLNHTHDLFQDFVQQQRPTLKVAEVATGETWYGSKAQDVGLIDAVQTSDEYLLQCLQDHEVYSVSYQNKKKLGERFLSAAHNLLQGRLPGY